ncbi:MAG: hypothetical protein C0398_04360 [Coprothermobacter sp.]|nr:hypothetical protein [Coprothermobacter sp.]
MPEIRRFDQITLGCANATNEATQFPQLLLDGYLDSHGLGKELLEGHRFLVLGPKGSGKTAVAEHLRLVADSDPSSTFVTLCNLGDFPYSDFRSKLGSEVAQERYPGGWSWLLLGTMLSSFARDAGGQNSDDGLFQEVTGALARTGLFAENSDGRKSGSPRGLRLKLAGTVALGIGAALEFALEPGAELPTLRLAMLKNATKGFRSESRHLLILDGLDDVLSQPEVRYDALAGLLYAVGDLNYAFRTAETPAKIILLCRTELFDRLPSANKNKMRMDDAVVLDWYDNPARGERCRLGDLVNLRTRMSDPRVDDVFRSFLPKSLGGKPMLQWLLDLTRCTPRDFIQLLTCIQGKSGNREGLLPEDVVIAGVREYSRSYFMPEIRDELAGYVQPAQIESVFRLFSSLRNWHFTYSELKDLAIREQLDSLDLASIMQTLFECSAIGNSFPREDKPGYFDIRYKYRNPTSSLNLAKGEIQLHKGLWKGLGVSY